MEGYDFYRNKRKFLVNLVVLTMVLICFVSFVLIFLGVKDNLVLNTNAMTNNSAGDNTDNTVNSPAFDFPKHSEIGETVNMEFINSLEKGTEAVEIYVLNDIYVLGHTTSSANEFQRENDSLIQFYAVFDNSGNLNSINYFGNPEEKLLAAKPYRNGFFTVSESKGKTIFYEIDIVNGTYRSLTPNINISKIYEILYVNDDICTLVYADNAINAVWVDDEFQISKILTVTAAENDKVMALSVSNGIFLSVSDKSLANYLIDKNKVELIDNLKNAELQSIYPFNNEVMVMYSNGTALKVIKYNLTEGSSNTVGLSGQYESGRIFSCGGKIYMIAENETGGKMIAFTEGGDYIESKSVNFSVANKTIYPFSGCFMLFSVEEGICRVAIVDVEGKIFFRENYEYGEAADFAMINSNNLIIFCGDEKSGVKIFKIVPPVFNV